MSSQPHQDPYESEATIELREYLAILKAHRWDVLSVTVLVLVVAIGLSASQTPRYTADARVLVETPIRDTTPTQVNLETERELANSEPVATIARDSLEVSTPIDTLLGSLSVSTPPEAEVLVFSYTSASPRLAREAADTFAEAYIAFKRNRQTEDFLAQEQALRDRIENAER